MNDLVQWQAVGQTVEEKMMEFLCSYAPAAELKICDAQCIARLARKIACDQFSKLRTVSN